MIENKFIQIHVISKAIKGNPYIFSEFRYYKTKLLWHIKWRLFLSWIVFPIVEIYFMKMNNQENVVDLDLLKSLKNHGDT